MKYIFFYTLIVLIFSSSGLEANTNRTIQLSNYSFNSTDNWVGNLSLSGITNNSKVIFRIYPIESCKFKILKSNQLWVEEFNFTLPCPFVDLSVSAEYEGEIFLDTLRILNQNFNNNKVIAHRGAWKNTGETENSIGALQAAMKINCAYSELDVNLSKDSILFVNHDAVIQNLKIDTTLSIYLDKIRLTNNEPLPRLSEFLNIIMLQNKTRLLIEIKPFSVSKERSIQAARLTVELVHKMKAQAWVEYISFSQDVLNKIREIDPFAKVSYLNGDLTPQKAKELKYDGLDYYYQVYLKNPSWILETQKLKLISNCWVINNSDEMKLFLKWGTDWITTDEPELLLDIINKKSIIN